MAEDVDQLMDIGELKDMSISKLTQIAKELDIPGATGTPPRGSARTMTSERFVYAVSRAASCRR